MFNRYFPSGINEKTKDDGVHLPFNQGFDFVGHFLPFTNSWACDDTGVSYFCSFNVRLAFYIIVNYKESPLLTLYYYIIHD